MSRERRVEEFSVEEIVDRAEELAEPVFKKIKKIAYHNQCRVLQAFKDFRVSSWHFHGSSGYGYGDESRDLLEALYARIFGGEDALVRHQIVSGTHALAGCLLGLLASGDLLLAAAGQPYDTLFRVIKGPNGLEAKGIIYQEIKPGADGGCDLAAVARAAKQKPKMVFIQRSRGYSTKRRSLLIREIKEIVEVVKEFSRDSIILVDNCYGEFVEEWEPGHVGADLVAGSLIKNPGGGLATGGGYVVGKKALVDRVAEHFTAPGLGKSIGPSLHDMRCFYQGLFMAPHVVGQALQGAVLTAAVFSLLGRRVMPEMDEPRGDIVQAVQMKSKEELELFARVVQQASPVESFVVPEFAVLPGYEDEVIMAAGTFVQGSSIELSMDAPLREPYYAFMQGGLSYEHLRHVVLKLVSAFFSLAQEK